MTTIRELFAKPIDRKIEEVIKVEQHNQEAVLGELEEYIVTDSIKDHFTTIYDEIIEVKRSPREGIGVWVSGFFGSGKSSFAKILGYTVAAIPVCQKPASEIFKEQVKDARISGLLDVITRTIPMDAVIFDVSMDRGVRTAKERITEIMYKALLRELDYAEDFDLAELEITLEQDGRLEIFVKQFEEIHGKPWKIRRRLGLGINEASAVLNSLDPKTYPQADSYARTVGTGRADITANELASELSNWPTEGARGRPSFLLLTKSGSMFPAASTKCWTCKAWCKPSEWREKIGFSSKKPSRPFGLWSPPRKNSMKLSTPWIPRKSNWPDYRIASASPLISSNLTFLKLPANGS